MKRNSSVLYYLHVVTISDGFALCDCIKKESMDTALMQGRDVGASLTSMLCMVKDDDHMTKGAYYQTAMRFLCQQPLTDYDRNMEMLQAVHRAYDIKEDTIYFYSYDVVMACDACVVASLEDVATMSIPAKPLQSNFLDAKTSSSLANKFVMYNCGAGLCTALLDYENKPCFLYDMGRTIYALTGNAGKGFHMDLSHIRWLCISHRHIDHFSYFLANIHKLSKIHLIINENFLSNHSITLNMYMVQYANKGQLYFLQEDVQQRIKYGSILLFSSKSKFASTKQLAHQNNICMEIDGAKRILVVGDNVYEDIAKTHMQDVDILCASHHGGKYWLCHPECLPLNTHDGTLWISASGVHNGHPSEIKRYQKAGWRNILYSYYGDCMTEM